MKELVRNIANKFSPIIWLNIIIILFEFLYILARFKYLNETIPFWYTKPWGPEQLTQKINIFLIPLLSSAILISGMFFIHNAKTSLQRYGDKIILFLVTLVNVMLAISVYRIVKIASSLFPSLLNPQFVQIALPTFISFLIVYLISPKIINIMKKRDIVTDPTKHTHPGMALRKPSARGGGLVFSIGFVVTSILFVKLTPMIVGLFVAVGLAAALGLLDDMQNTINSAKIKWIGNPMSRILLQVVITLPLIVSGVQVLSINNPLNGIISLNTIQYSFFGINYAPIAIIFTIIWMLWIMNLLSWSNGVDGQFAGVIGIAGLMIAFITLRLLPFDPSQKDMVQLAAIAAGSSLGILPYSWHPSKIMWGFGAISAGVVLASLSVVSQAKIATSFIILIVPFLDGALTIIRRVINKQSPFKGDRGHLHHLLLERGWSVKQVAVFYWIATALFGIAGVFAADKSPILTAMTGAGIVAFFIVALNVKSLR